MCLPEINKLFSGTYKSDEVDEKSVRVLMDRISLELDELLSQEEGDWKGM